MNRTRAATLAAVAGAVGAAACVSVDLAPGGVASALLTPTPPAIVIGDSLRDSTGTAIPLHGVAYDANGKVITTASFRYAYVPSRRDTTTGQVIDTALVVDSVTGYVRAMPTWVVPTGHMAARVGARLQVLDSVAIVAPPDSLVPTDTTRTLRFDCVDSTAVPEQGPAGAPDTTFGNTVGPFTLAVKGDSAGTQVGVRRWLVRWSVDSVSTASGPVAAPIPTATLPNGVTVPAIAVITNTADQVVRYDTTDATGTSNVRLRIRPYLLGKTYVADTIFRVTLRADVIGAQAQPVSNSPVRGAFAIRLMRQSAFPASANAACRI